MEPASGGGGGVSSTTASSGATGGGGAAGGYTEKRMTMAASTWFNYGVATAVLGGVGLSGTSGTVSVFSGSTVLAASGGTGGAIGQQTATATKFILPGSGKAGYSGDITAPGNTGGYGMMTSQVVGMGGAGADGMFGGGGVGPVTSSANGGNALGVAAGGAGALLITSGLRSGGSGAQGMIIIDEYSA